ncbi:MAG: FAD-dependent monooxygenase [Thermoguttaceae bacterium]|jgi:flavin-dependent dehydrogenase
MTGSLADPIRREWDVLVVGAGPAGAMAACLLAREGVAVLLLDKAAFPRWKVCGCCLNGLALSTLEAAGLGDLPEQLHAQPLRQFHIATHNGHASVPLPVGVSLSRETFDAALIDEAVRAGAVFLPRTSAFVRDEANGLRAVTLMRQGEAAVVRARVVLVADGLAGQALKHLSGFDVALSPNSRLGAAAVLEAGQSFYQPGTIYMACGHGGYVGLVRLEDGRLDVAAALDRTESRLQGGPAHLVARLLNEAGLPLPEGLPDAAWRGTPALTRRRQRISAERLFVVGDSAGYVEPFTGEGMAWAMLSASLAVPLARMAVDRWTPELGEQWESRYRRFLRPRQRVVRAASYVLKHPRVTEILVQLLTRAPRLAASVIRTINAPAGHVSGS